MKLRGDYLAVAVFLGIWAVLRVWNYFSLGDWDLILWSCFVSLVLLVFGLYYRSVLLVSVVATLSVLPALISSVEILAYTLFDWMTFGSVNYLLESNWVVHVLTFYHLFLVIVPLYVLIKEKKFCDYSWAWASGIAFVVSLVSFVFAKSNVNCVREFCDFGIFNLINFLKPEFMPFWIFYWLAFTLVVYIPMHFVLKAVALRGDWK